MTDYVVGMGAKTGEPFQISEDSLARHVLVVGSEGTGKTNTLRFLAESQLWKRRKMSVFDSDGNLCDYVFNQLVYHRTDPRTVILLDPAMEMILGFNPLMQQSHGSVVARLQRMTQVIIDAGERMGVLHSADTYRTNPGDEIKYVFAALTNRESYLTLSLEGGVSVDFFDVLVERKQFLAKIPLQQGSQVYGMLLFESMLIAAEYCEQQDLYLIFIDELPAFLPAIAVDSFAHLSENRISLIMSCTYGQLAWFKIHCRPLYNALLSVGSICAFAAHEQGVDDIVLDVAKRIQGFA